MKVKYLLLLIVSFLGVVSIAYPANIQKKKVAVLEFRSNSIDLIMGPGFSSFKWTPRETSALTADLIYALANDPNFEVMDRERLKAIEKEQARTKRSLLSLKEIGQVSGADYLIYGDIELVEANKRQYNFPSSGIKTEEFFGRFVINLRVVEVSSSKVIFAKKVSETAAETINKDTGASPLSFMNKLKEKAVRLLVSKISESISPIKVAAVKDGYAYLNRGEGSSLQPGMKMSVFLPCRAILDPDTGEALGNTEYLAGELKITEILPKLTKAQISYYSMPIEPGAVCRVAIQTHDEPNLHPISQPSSENPVNW